MQELAIVAQEAVEVSVAGSPAKGPRIRAWNICATVVIIWLAISPLIQESFHRSSVKADIIPNDFPGFYVPGQIVKLKAPENLLYYPPDRKSWTYLDLRRDAKTPYGKAVPANAAGLPFVKEPFITPPFSALMMEPLASLSWEKAYLLWQLLTVLLMMASVYLALRLAQDDLPALVLAIALSISFLFRPFRAVLVLGNIDVVVLLLWVLGAFALRRRYPIPSAICFALATAIKFSPILAVPLMVLRRQWRWLVAYTLASGALLALSVWKVGWQNHLVWARQVAPAISGGVKMFLNRSLPGFILALADPHGLNVHMPGAPAWILFNKALSGIGYLGLLFWIWRQRKDAKALPFELILWPLVVLLLSPTTGTNHYILAVPALIYLWVRLRAEPATASNLDLVLLTGCTMMLGSILPDSAVLALGLPLELPLMAGWVAATGALIWMGMSLHKGVLSAHEGCVN